MTDAKARLLQMIADEPHMGGGGLLKAVTKAQKTAKAAKATKTVERVAAPQEEALRLAQKRAALPIAQGGLGLPSNNTPAQRAAAMGFDADVYHGSKKDFDKFKGDQPVFAAEDPDIARLYGNAIYPLKLRGKVLEISDLGKDGAINRFPNNLAKELKIPRKELEDLRVPSKQIYDSSFLNNLESLFTKKFGDAQFSDIGEREMVNKLPKYGIDRLKVTDMSDMGGTQTQHMIPAGSENIRSRFAAFDPFRRNAATAALMGVAAPDLLADEKKAGGGLLKAVSKAQKTAKKAKMYSAVDKALEASKRGAGTGMEFANELSKTSGIKKAELVDRGIMVPSKNGPVLNPALTQLPKMSKQEFVSHLNEKYKPPGVKKITLSPPNLTDELIDKKAMQMMADDVNDYVERNGDADYEEVFNSRYDNDYDKYYQNAKDELEQEGSSKFGEYKLPGAENYRENLYQYENPKGKAFLESHWDDPNILYHMRQTDRVTPTYTSAQIDAIGQRMADAMGTKVENLGSGAPISMMRKGVISPVEAAQFAHAKGFLNMDIDMTPAQRRALHIEEIQSDWHQKGRDKGYANPFAETQYVQYLDDLQQRVKQNIREDYIAEGVAPEKAEQLAQSMANRMAEDPRKLANYLDEEEKRVALHTERLKAREGIPDAPLKKNWHEHALKQALMDAAEGDYDQLLITPGAKQAERYSLKNMLDSLSVGGDQNGIRQVSWMPVGQRTDMALKFDKNGVVVQSMLPELKDKHLSDVFGKEMAEKIMGAEPYQRFEGLDLEVGGKGMEGFYDKMLPSYLNDLGKKYGVRVGERAIEGEVPYSKTTPTLADVQRLAQEMYGVSDLQAISALPLEQRNALNQVFADRVKAEHTTKLHSFDITPEMREDILNNGLPMYQRGGEVHMAGGGKPKPTAEELAAMRAKQFPKFNIQDQMLGNSNQFNKDRANQLYPKKETMNPIVKAAKDKLDQFNAFIDRGVPVKELVGGLTGAIPFVGPKLRKDLEGATVDFPLGFERLPGNEQVATGSIETAPAKVTDILDSLKMSDLTGGTGASSVLNSVGKGYMPDPLDLLDATTLALPAYGIAKAGVKAGAKGAGALSNLAKSETGYKLAQKVINSPYMAPMSMNIIKEPGGNWLGGETEKQLKKLQMGDTIPKSEVEKLKERIESVKKVTGDTEDGRRLIRGLEVELDTVTRNNAMNAWMESNLNNYVKKQMGTVDDPVRKLAEQGILHMEPFGNADAGRLTMRKRAGLGYPYQGVGESDKAKFWERLSDAAIDPYPAGSYKHGTFDESILLNNPWLQKVPDETMINSAKGLTRDLGFDHITDVLREDLAAGRIRPEQLSKVSMEQAVRRTYEYDQELAAKMNAARAAAREGLPVQKEYPEGFRWVQLNKPGAFASESEAMGHSVRGYEPPKGHPDWVEGSGNSGSSGYGHGGWEAIKSGKAKVYSLVDKEGQPHVTVEVRAKKPETWNDAAKEVGPEKIGEYWDEFHALKDADPSLKDPVAANKKLIEFFESKGLRGNQDITQIKGKQNRAPKEDYLPFVQDFVKGGNWSDVGDIQNTGLIEQHSLDRKIAKDVLGLNLPRYVTPQEAKDYMRLDVDRHYQGDKNLEIPESLVKYKIQPDTPEPSMAEGGDVKSFFEEKSAKQRLLDMIAEEPHMGNGVRPSRLQLQGEIANDTYGGIGGGGRATYTHPIGSDAAIRAYMEGGGYKPKDEPYKGQVNNMGISYEMGFKDGGEVHMAGGGISTLQKIAKAAKAAEAAKKAAEVAAKAAKVVPTPAAPAFIPGLTQKSTAADIGREERARRQAAAAAEAARVEAAKQTPVPVGYVKHTEKSPNPHVGYRYEATQHPGIAQPIPIDLAKLEREKKGASLGVMPWDSQSRNVEVSSISGEPLQTHLYTHAGQPYSLDEKHLAKLIGGASAEEVADAIKTRDMFAAKENRERGGTGEVVHAVTTMGQYGENYSHPPSDFAFEIINRRLQEGRLTKKDLQELNNSIRTFQDKKKQVEQGIFPYANFAGFETPEGLQQIYTGGLGLNTSSGNLRKAIAAKLHKVGTQELLGFNSEDLINATTVPSLRGVDKGYLGGTLLSNDIGNAGFYGPRKDRFGMELAPAEGFPYNSPYSTDFSARYYGQLPDLVPLDVVMHRQLAPIEQGLLARENKKPYTAKSLRNSAIGSLEKSNEGVSQIMDARFFQDLADYFDALNKPLEKKKGGLAQTKKVKRHGNTVSN